MTSFWHISGWFWWPFNVWSRRCDKTCKSKLLLRCTSDFRLVHNIFLIRIILIRMVIYEILTWKSNDILGLRSGQQVGASAVARRTTQVTHVLNVRRFWSRRRSDVWVDVAGSKTCMGTQVSTRDVHNCGRRGFFFGGRRGLLIRVS